MPPNPGAVIVAVFGFDEGVGALDEGVDFGVGDVAVEVELYPVSKALIERVAHRQVPVAYFRYLFGG